MAEKQLPYFEIKQFLKDGNITEAKKLFSECDPNAVAYGSNIYSLFPMPREFASWAKEQGADINFRDPYGRTPIFKIAQKDGDISLYIDLGADIEAVSITGCTPLHIAAAYGNQKAMRALLKAGAKIDAQTKDYDGFGHFTPLETVLYSDLSCVKKYDTCKFLLDRGAEMTERSRLFVSSFSESFYRHTLGKKATKSLPKQAEALEKLCQLFDAKMLRETSFHDGVSPIIITTIGGGYNNIFNELWNFLVPPSGKAQTAQGEMIRIAGRIQDELMRNGGMNWDEDYRKMLYTFREYLRIGNPILESEQYIQEIIDTLKDGDVNDNKIWDLCHCAEYWVSENPEVMPLLEADYTR